MCSRERTSRWSFPERRAVSLLVFGLLVVSFACGDPYLHTNPYDPAVPVTITVTGPDSIFNYREQARFGTQIVPAFPDSAVQFSSSDSIAFPPAGAATFVANATPLWPATRTVTVVAGVGAIDTQPPAGSGVAGPAAHITAWRHTGSKLVVLTQRVMRILLRCPDAHACDPQSAGGVWSVWVDGFDATNQKIVSLTSATANPATGTPIATFVSRDTSIASASPVGIRAATVAARKSGSTWIVATRGSLLDSLALVVR
jgi:hypothetical protein